MKTTRWTPIALLLALAGCTPLGAAVGAGASVGVAAVEERGLGGAIDDAKIRLDINHLWFQHDLEMYRQVTLAITEGRVLLTGTVDKPEYRLDAVRLAWQAAGVRTVINEIQVSDQTGFADLATDLKIANQLRSKLLFDKAINNVNYTIDSVNSVVYLMGIAQNQAEIDRVVGHAREVPHVKRIANHVLLKSDPRRFEFQR
ncbi:MAG: BON domain-containing protein [Rhodospirillales bacterium]|nr:BON domain-containing protein [Rhodospirillales bacterium]